MARDVDKPLFSAKSESTGEVWRIIASNQMCGRDLFSKGNGSKEILNNSR